MQFVVDLFNGGIDCAQRVVDACQLGLAAQVANWILKCGDIILAFGILHYIMVTALAKRNLVGLLRKKPSVPSIPPDPADQAKAPAPPKLGNLAERIIKLLNQDLPPGQPTWDSSRTGVWRDFVPLSGHADKQRPLVRVARVFKSQSGTRTGTVQVRYLPQFGYTEVTKKFWRRASYRGIHVPAEILDVVVCEFSRSDATAQPVSTTVLRPGVHFGTEPESDDCAVIISAAQHLAQVIELGQELANAEEDRRRRETQEAMEEAKKVAVLSLIS